VAPAILGRAVARSGGKGSALMGNETRLPKGHEVFANPPAALWCEHFLWHCPNENNESATKQASSIERRADASELAGRRLQPRRRKRQSPQNFTSVSLGFHFDLTSVSRWFHSELTSISLRWHCDVNSSLRIHLDVTSGFMRAHFEFASISLRVHFDFS
jgi:hypothetical protein